MRRQRQGRAASSPAPASLEWHRVLREGEPHKCSHDNLQPGAAAAATAAPAPAAARGAALREVATPSQINLRRHSSSSPGDHVHRHRELGLAALWPHRCSVARHWSRCAVLMNLGAAARALPRILACASLPAARFRIDLQGAENHGKRMLRIARSCFSSVAAIEIREMSCLVTVGHCAR